MAPPPAPPAPPPPPPPAPTGGDGVVEDAAGALFAEIAKLGEGGVRAGLKKGVRGPVNEEAPSPSAKAAPVQVKKPAAKPTGTPKCELSGKKWNVENQVGNKDLVIEATMKQVSRQYAPKPIL